ncbi:DNA-formamidopyrimidine glycosylase [Pullulanibacillus sp. KACC 23026]|uniref:DNA-formamidopyrimidine glycosylase n=1 Tax=Pullulanibacillus sp. KACC 23026 TaxID=3028315 RepID=UPI0023AF52AA|nr:DNA-formamidopyrimidine glycosylase [Pullulanibacillus sp. KACC 23026]WEG13030.1 DNA-formamidopyrimidine glycosylase [Pullulanibacillus sp. KACC 23026]
MPELPEMEHYKRVLVPRFAGKTLTHVRVEREKSVNLPIENFISKTVGQSIQQIRRRAKYLAFSLSNGKILLLHLMLGGKLYFGKEADSPNHTKQIMLYAGEEALFFIGLRLGYLHLLTEEELAAEWSNLGPEPLSDTFTVAVFMKRLKAKRGKLKALLVDQSFVAGIGNRYSDEICFEAALHPGRTAQSLSDQEIESLFSAMRGVLLRAIDQGGYIDLPIYLGDQITGGAEEQMKVHRRAGEACIRCGYIIVEEKIASKKTSFCPNCQH